MGSLNKGCTFHVVTKFPRLQTRANSDCVPIKGVAVSWSISRILFTYFQG